MRRLSRLRLGVATVVALGLAVAGCGSGGSSSSSSGGSSGSSGSSGSGGSASSGSAQNVSLRMTVWTSNKDQLALFDAIAKDYENSHPNVTSIKFDPLPYDSYTTALTTQIAGGNPPDLGWIFERDAPTFVSSGTLMNLTPTLKATDGYDYSDLSPAALKLWQSGDGLYAYPFSTSPFAMFYNKDLFAKAGVETPDKMIADGTYTWDNVEKAAAKITAANSGKYGLVVRDFDYKAWEELAEVWRGFGASAWSADGKTCKFTDPQMVDAMTFIHKAIFDDKAMPPPGTTVDFLAGDAGMTTTQISRAASLKDAKFGWGIAPLPKGPSGAAQVIGQAGIGVFSKSKHAKEAADFLAFFTNPDNSKKLAQYFPPPRQSQITTDVLGAANPLIPADELQSAVVDSIKSGAVLPAHQDFAKIEQAAQASLDAMWKPDADVKGVLSDVCGSIKPLLNTGS